MVGFADTAMVGHHSTAELSSASFVNNLFNVVIFAMMGFSYGLTPIIGALFGRGCRDDIGRTVRNAVVANLLFALVVTAVMTVIYFNLRHLGQPPELLPIIRPYYLIYLAGIAPLALFNTFAQWAYAINRTRMPMWIILISNAMNIAGNYALIYGHWSAPEMGLEGAGVSTLAARIFCAVAIIAVFMTRHEYGEYRRGFARSRVDRGNLRYITSTSIPVALQMGFESGSFTMAAVMAGWLGALELASYQITVIMGSLGFCVYYSMGAATSVLVANAAGAGDRRLMRRTAYAGYRIILALACCASAVFIFCAEPIFRIFTDDRAVIALSMTLVVPLVVYQLGDATQITFANALRGTSNVMPMMWISFVAYVVVGIPATYLLAFTCGLELYGIVLSFSASLFVAGALFLHYFLASTRPKTV